MIQPALVLMILLLTPAEAFKPAEVGACSLKQEEGTPLLILEGSPEQMGEAHGKLLAAESAALMDSYLKPAALMSGGLGRLEARAWKMEPHIPKRYRRELEALAKASGLDYKMLVTGNAFPDVYRGGGCSCLAVANEGEPILGRNLDFFSFGVLDKYGLVAVYKPEGYHGFVSITWPALNGVLSGMNEKGLCAAVMEVRTGRRSLEGMPSTYLFRRVMEEAATVKQALKILEPAKKAASNNLILLDPSGASVLVEMGPGYFAVRGPEKGAVFGTNHHRKGIKPEPQCHRYKKLNGFLTEHAFTVEVEQMKEALNMVNQGMLTVQSMVFEPRSLKLHLAMGKIPATRGEYRILSLGKLLRKNDP